MADTISSRIFVKGLPPTFSEAEFRKHFSQGREITDAKIFPNRRIGYVGYRTAEDAQKAVKYFNRTFIRMSKIGVELARPIQDARNSRQKGAAPTAQRSTKVDSTVDATQNLKRKRDSEPKQEDDPKLKEFLDVMKPKSKKKAWENDNANVAETAAQEGATMSVEAGPEAQSDDEYEEVPKTSKRAKVGPAPEPEEQHGVRTETETSSTESMQQVQEVEAGASGPNVEPSQSAATDADWARSRTSRLLGLLDDDEEETEITRKHDDLHEPINDEGFVPKGYTKATTVGEAPQSMPTPPSDSEHDETAETINAGTGSDGVQATMRLFIRNLPYDVREEDLEAEYAPFDNLDEIHVPRDLKTGSAKGFAYVQFTDPESAQRALEETDGQSFQGRLLHVLPATAKRETKLDDFALSKLPLKKQQQIKRKREAASTNFNWNALYMNADAVVSSVADRLGLSKSEVLDPTSSDAAVKQAHAETHIIQETKAYFKQQGVDLDAFRKSQRGDTAILVKNIPYDCSKDELKRLFEEHGDIKRFVMPPSGVIAIVEFKNAAQCKAAFGALAYKKVKSSILFLEKAPRDLFNSTPTSGEAAVADGVNKASASDLKDADYTVPDAAGTATLFVRNLNFTTTTEILTETFRPLDGLVSARVKTKTDPKRPGQVLSMGFGFLEFRSASQAQAALKAMDGYTLEGHKLQLRASHKGADAAEERRKADAAKRAAGKKTKVIIKNLPFEATKKDVRALFGAYGQLRSVRMPKKMDRGARGFAFADFTTPKEAESAMDALKDTHLLGRRLVLDFAAGDAEDAEAEIEKMQKKVGAQVNKVALQKLTSGGRKKFTTANEEED